MRSGFTLFLFFVLSISFINIHSDLKATEVVPPNYKNTPGNGTFLSPLSTAARTYQLLIHSSQLTSFVGKNLTAISWRSTASASTPWPVGDATISSYRILLSGSVDPANRSLAHFSDNVVGPQTQVRSGALLIPSGSYTSGNSPNEFGPEIIFDIPYAYSGGNLLIEIRQSGVSGTSRSNDALLASSTPEYGTDFSACWKATDTATYSASQGNFAIVKISTAPTNLNLNLSAFIEARYNSATDLMVSDTAKVLLHSSIPPYAIVDSSVAVLDAYGNGIFNFNEALEGINYYITLNHRNSIETWSSTFYAFNAANLSYDFASSSAQAFGNNQIQIDASPVRFANYSGDVNKDGVVDVSDANGVDNDAFNGVAGYVLTDVNGDNIVDVSDANYVDNNSFIGVFVIKP